MRCMLDPGHPQLGEYIDSFELGAVVSGGGVGVVTESRAASFSVGDTVCAPFLGWPWRTEVRALPAAPIPPGRAASTTS